MRGLTAILFAVSACASAGLPGTGDDDDDGHNMTGPDGSVAMPDAPPSCSDDDSDGVCNALDKCAGHPDSLDTDADTIADGCDRCAGADDRIDVNTNTVPDCVEVQTRTINLKAVGTNLWRGWHASTGGHTTDNDNTLTGVYNGATYNSYYVFTLSGFTAGVITNVTLEMQLEMFNSTDASETFSVWDVTTASSTLETTGGTAATVADLQSGAQYATTTATNAQVNSILSIPLSAQAATDAKAKVGSDFVVGMHLDTPPGYIRFGHTGSTATPTVIRVVVTYLP